MQRDRRPAQRVQPRPYPTTDHHQALMSVATRALMSVCPQRSSRLWQGGVQLPLWNGCAQQTCSLVCLAPARQCPCRQTCMRCIPSSSSTASIRERGSGPAQMDSVSLQQTQGHAGVQADVTPPGKRGRFVDSPWQEERCSGEALECSQPPFRVLTAMKDTHLRIIRLEQA